jgi:hypothetical protein
VVIQTEEVQQVLEALVAADQLAYITTELYTLLLAVAEVDLTTVTMILPVAAAVVAALVAKLVAMAVMQNMVAAELKVEVELEELEI